LVIGCQLLKYGGHLSLGMDRQEGFPGICAPETVFSNIIACFIEPELHVIFKVRGIMQPPALIKMMPGGAADRIVFPCPGNRRQELSDNKPCRRFPDMLAVSPPSEII